MSGPELRLILGGPEYVGPVAGVKQEYQVYRTGRGDFVVFSKSGRSNSSFFMTFVPATRVEMLGKLVPKAGTTVASMLKEKKVVALFDGAEKEVLYFEVLTTLYVLAALSSVGVSKSGRSLVFTPGVQHATPAKESKSGVDEDLADD